MKNRKTRSAMRRMLFTLALVLVVAVASVGGTIAWLTATTGTVTNTFTVGDVNIELKETDGDTTLDATTEDKTHSIFKIIPGKDLTKDPKVIVKANSEPCYVFVKVKASNWPEAKVTYSINATNWKKLEGITGLEAGETVYYKVFNSIVEQDTPLEVLTDNKVEVSENLTKAEMATIRTNGNPSLVFTAYAIQKEGTGTVAEAWAKIGA